MLIQTQSHQTNPTDALFRYRDMILLKKDYTSLPYVAKIEFVGLGRWLKEKWY